MSGIPFHYIDLRTFCYATEDEARVQGALRQFLPDEVAIDRIENEGFNGDRIVVLSARVENADEIRHVLDELATIDLDEIRAELEERVDENCSLFLRLDKQAAYGGRVERGPGIELRAKVEAYPAKKAAAVENAADALESRA
jgi:RNA binding exosome subunit